LMIQLRVRDLMTTQVITVKPTDTVRQAVIKMAVDNVTGAPVVDNRNHVVGIISQNDVLRLIVKEQNKLIRDYPEPHYLLGVPMDGENPDEAVTAANKEISQMKVEDIMVRSVLYISADAEIIEALQAMMTMGVNRLPVLEQGVLIGTISRSDIIFFIYKKKV
ncbi:MAG: CBS domain-containing protein, partial [Candidatus Methanomethylophilus sp.]|nr:CBS domain-containing protein [Methanomethylophilus sp.]